MQGKYPDDTAVIKGDIALNGIMQERLSRKGRVVKVRNFRGATVVDMKHHAVLLLHKEPSRHQPSRHQHWYWQWHCKILFLPYKFFYEKYFPPCIYETNQ